MQTGSAAGAHSSVASAPQPDNHAVPDSLRVMTTKHARPACCTVAAAIPIDEEMVSRTATAFKALGDPHRLTMVQLIARSGEALCVCDLEEHLPLSQPTVSHHLKILADAGILTRERQGRWAYYSIDEARLDEMRLDISSLT